MRTDLRPLALLLGVSILTGCAVGPDYRSPEIDASSHFLGQEAIVQRDVERMADLTAWWAGFDDPLLTRFISLALEQNLDIAQAAARVAQSRASLRLADAALLPSANVSANAARTYQSVETPLGQLLSATRDFDRNGSYYEANLNASWEIDVFGGLRRGREAARAEYDASEAGAIATRLAVAAQTADVYVTIRGLQARIVIARQQAQTRRELLSTVKLQFEKGIAAELQMRQVEGSLAQVEAQIPVLESGLDAAMNALDVLLAAQPGTYRAELGPEASIPTAPGLAETGTPAEDVENAFSALVKRETQAGILTRGESSLARARENSAAAYKGGVVSLIEVLDADSNLLQVRDAKAQAQTEAARAAIASFRALGGGWDAPTASSNGLYSNLSSTDRR